MTVQDIQNDGWLLKYEWTFHDIYFNKKIPKPKTMYILNKGNFVLEFNNLDSNIYMYHKIWNKRSYIKYIGHCYDIEKLRMIENKLNEKEDYFADLM